jgi:ribosomal protein L7/L12
LKRSRIPVSPARRDLLDDVSSLDDQEVIEALQTGKLIEAIKVYRQIHNVDLAEAKSAVENIKARLGR